MDHINKIEFLSIDPDDVAQILIQIEFNIFKTITPLEILAAKDKSTYSQTISSMIARFNTVSQWVASEIVVEANFKKRVSVLKRFIQIARKCLNLNSYNTLLEIIAGLNMVPVTRLKKTWAALPPKYTKIFHEYDTLMENKQNFRSYREALRNTHPPCLPYFGVVLRDVTFLDVGNPDYIDKHINMEKLLKLHNTIASLQTWQTNPYNHKISVDIRDYLTNLTSYNESELDRFSIVCESTIRELP